MQVRDVLFTLVIHTRRTGISRLIVADGLKLPSRRGTYAFQGLPCPILATTNCPIANSLRGHAVAAHPGLIFQFLKSGSRWRRKIGARSAESGISQSLSSSTDVCDRYARDGTRLTKMLRIALLTSTRSLKAQFIVKLSRSWSSREVIFENCSSPSLGCCLIRPARMKLKILRRYLREPVA